MRKFGIIEPIWKSFYSKVLYADVAYAWKGTGASFMLIIAVLACLPPAAATHFSLREFAADQGQKIIAQIPDIAISEGKLSTPDPRPYTVQDPASGSLLAVIDMTRENLPEEMAKGPKPFVFVLKNAVVVKKSAYETRTFDLSQVAKFSIDQQRLRGWLALFARWGASVLGLFMLVFVYVVRLIQVLLFSVLTNFLRKMWKVPIDYQAVLRLTAVAMGPALVLSIFGDALGRPVSFAWFCLLTVVFIWFGVQAVRESAPPAAGVEGEGINPS